MRALKSDERALWREIIRGVKPLRDAAPDEAKLAPSRRKPAATRAPAAKPTPAKPTVAKQAAVKPIAALDRRSAQRLKRGTTAIEARLDLHGMTQTEAHAALSRFLARAQKNGSRTVLVITGKSGVLHNAVPRWLNEDAHRGAILAIARAHTQHGGEGALYLTLRRKK
jgi:DNA-nicking Smr family endonuclease